MKKDFEYCYKYYKSNQKWLIYPVDTWCSILKYESVLELIRYKIPNYYAIILMS